MGYDIVLDEITEVNHLAITKAGRGGSSVAVIDSIIRGGLKPMRTGIFAFLTNKKQKVNDSAFSFGKTVLEAVKNSKGTTEEEIAGEMKGVLDSMSVLKDCEAKTKLTDVVKDCFDNKELSLENETELVSTLDSMYVSISGDSLEEIAKAFSAVSFGSSGARTVDSKESKEDEDEDSKETKEDKDKDSKESKEDKDEDSKDKKEGEDKDSKESKEDKDGCHANKDSAVVASIMDSLKKELKPLVTEAVKECLGLKDSKSSVEGSELDSANKNDGLNRFDYESFI